MRFTHVTLSMLLVCSFLHDTPSALATDASAKFGQVASQMTSKNVGPLQKKQALRGRRVQSTDATTASTAAPGTQASTAAPEATMAAPDASTAVPGASTAPPDVSGAAEFLQMNGQIKVLTELLQSLQDTLDMGLQGDGIAEVDVNSDYEALLEARDSFICSKGGKAGKKKKKAKRQKGNRALQDDPLTALEDEGDETIAELEAFDEDFDSSDSSESIDSDSSDSSGESFNGLSLSDESIEDAQKAVQQAEKDATATMLMIQEYKSDVADPDTDLKKLARSGAKAGRAVMKTMRKIEEAIAKVEYALGLPLAEDAAPGGADDVRRVLQKGKKGPKTERKRGKAMGKEAKEARMAEKAAKKEAKAKARAERLKKLENIQEKLEKEGVVVDDLIDLVERDIDDDDDDCELPDFDIASLAETLFRENESILSEIDAILEDALEASDGV